LRKERLGKKKGGGRIRPREKGKEHHEAGKGEDGSKTGKIQGRIGRRKPVGGHALALDV